MAIEICPHFPKNTLTLSLTKSFLASWCRDTAEMFSTAILRKHRWKNPAGVSCRWAPSIEPHYAPKQLRTFPEFSSAENIIRTSIKVCQFIQKTIAMLDLIESRFCINTSYHVFNQLNRRRLLDSYSSVEVQTSYPLVM